MTSPIKTTLSIFPIIKRMNEASSVLVPLDLIRDLSGLYQPPQINEICFQYKIWHYLSHLEECCESCGNHLPIGSKSTTKTCSNRCHQLVKRSQEKGEPTPMDNIRIESREKLQCILSVWDKSKQYPYKEAYPWHKVTDGWRVASII